MAVRWRTRRTAPAPAEDGRWGVARLVAQREAERLARERDAPGSGGATEDPAEPDAPATPTSGPSVGGSATRGPFVAAGPQQAPRPGPAPRTPPGREGRYRPPAVPARPPVDPEPGLVGFSRLTRGRTGSRVFTLVFVAIYLVILVQTLSTVL